MKTKDMIKNSVKFFISLAPSNEKTNLRECKNLPLVMKSKPTLVYAEVCTYCNIKCRMCGRNVHGMSKSDQGFMKQEIFENLTELFTQGGNLAMFGRGETLLHPKFPYFLKLSKEKGMNICFNSNGKALTKSIADAMVQYRQRSITFSCSAAKEETYEMIHAGGKWNQLWENITYLTEAKEKLYGMRKYRRPAIYLEFVVQKDNIKELPMLIEKAIKKGLNGVVVIDMVAHSDELEKQRMNTSEMLPVAKRYYKEAHSMVGKLKHLCPYFDLRLPNGYDPITKKFSVSKESEKTSDEVLKKLDCGNKKNMCLEPWQTFYVRHNGKVAPCVITNRNLGDLNKEDAIEIWNGPNFQKFRERMRSKNKPFECLRCHLFPGPQRYDKALDNADEYESL